MMKWVIFLVLILLLINCEGTSTMESYTYLALGDSYTIGESVPPDSSYPYQVYERLQANGLDMEEPVIIARTGWTTDELQAAIDPEAVTPPYNLVTLLIGVNNQYRGRDIDNYDIEFTELLNQAVILAGGEPGNVIVISIPDWGVTPFAGNRDRETIGKEIDEFNRVNYTRAQEAKVHYVDVTEISRTAADDTSLIAGDGLHPSAKMYALWTDKIAPLAETLLISGK
jgi:lysophospholipase L1-like esterase